MSNPEHHQGNVQNSRREKRKGVGKGGLWRIKAAAILAAGEKRCRKCGKVKPLQQFSIYKAKLDGRLHICRVCERTPEYKAAHVKYQHKYEKTAKGRAARHRYEAKQPKVQWEIILKNGMKQYVIDKTGARAQAQLRRWGVNDDDIVSCERYVR
jgi:hypothetical protein